eukprot:6058336-Pleurochrysis_carterae.AAC.1
MTFCSQEPRKETNKLQIAQTGNQDRCKQKIKCGYTFGRYRATFSVNHTSLDTFRPRDDWMLIIWNSRRPVALRWYGYGQVRRCLAGRRQRGRAAPGLTRSPRRREG